MKRKTDSSLMIKLTLITIINFSIGTAFAIDYESIATAERAVLEDHYPTRKIEFDQKVIGLADVIYASVNGFQPLKLDLYLPPETDDINARYPVILMIHGGGWSAGHSRHSGAFSNWPETMAKIAAEGYVVASINYRLSGEAPSPAAIQDVKSAILFLRANAQKYSIDPTRIVSWGGSAGGQLAALAAVSCDLEELAPDANIPGLSSPDEFSDCLQGAVIWYGIFDFTELAADPNVTRSPVAAYLDCVQTCPEENIRLASAMKLLDSDAPPFLLIHGVDDEVVSASQSSNFQAKLENMGIQSELILIPDVNHSFIGANAAITRAASLRALKASMEFVESILGK